MRPPSVVTGAWRIHHHRVTRVIGALSSSASGSRENRNGNETGHFGRLLGSPQHVARIASKTRAGKGGDAENRGRGERQSANPGTDAKQKKCRNDRQDRGRDDD